ncbi:hypothetical protein LCGC14_2390140 [marine sediment metagenome]|uniref:DNA ligase D 3'-phosphoesterase domain-containing protein n=1 Tax=marine sediment metagenome TaxID=412755 RepID=A0A0F9BYI7_9ZZZZ
MIRVDRRFVIQFHHAPDGEHYDLMLELADVLATWRLADSPAELAPGGRLDARALGDHRKAYLSYQGAVSGGRGTVRIAEEGTYRLAAREDDRWIFELQGRRITGSFELTRLEGDHWRLGRAPDRPVRRGPSTPRG